MKKMYKKHLLMKTLVVLMFISLLLPSKAYAYVDPGSGSYFFQVVLAAILGAGFTIRLYWKNFKDLLRRILSSGKSNKDEKD